MFSNIKHSIGASLRASGLLAAVILPAAIMFGFLAAAAFVFVLERHGPVAACLTGAGIFLIVTAIAGTIYAGHERARQQQRLRERAAQPPPLAGLLSDPALLGMGLQAVRSIGLKRLVPLLAIGGLAIGLMAGRHGGAHAEEPAE